MTVSVVSSPTQACTIMYDCQMDQADPESKWLGHNVFSAHSTRGTASTAVAIAGMSTQQMARAAAGWSSADTFCQHYYRPPAEAANAANFGQAVLKDTTNMQRTC